MKNRKYRIKNKIRWRAFISITSAILLGLIVYILYVFNQPSYAETKQTKYDVSDLHIRAVQIEPLTAFEYGLATQPQSEAPTLPQYNIGLSKELQEYTFNECLYYDVSYELELALMYTESRFNDLADNGVSRGICQINRNTAKKLADDLQIENFNSFNAKHNVSASIYYIKQIRDYWREQGYCEEDVTLLSLISYNRGLAGCKSYIKSYSIYNDYYANKVLGYKEQLEQYRQIVD